MKCVIIGLGYFGSIIKGKLVDHECITVDPYKKDADYKNVLGVPESDGFWFITTPASTHHEILIKLFNRGVKNIWVEKPICSTLTQTLDIFAKKPDDVFLYCDFTWLQHSAIKKLGSTCHNIRHIEMKWLNDGSMIPQDVNIVTDLAVHPISILTYFLMKSRDIIESIHVVYASESSVLINGTSHQGTTFNIEVSNTSKRKNRSVSMYCTENVYRWSSENQYSIECIGDVEKTDAIEENISYFFSKNSIGYPLDIARTLEIVDKQFRSFDK